MKRIFFTVLITLILVAAIQFAASQMFGVVWISGKHAVVTIKNESDKSIKRLALTHNSGFIEANSLLPKRETQFIFQNSSENTYKVFAVFENDSVVTTEGRYFEYGYRSTLSISDSGIVITD